MLYDPRITVTHMLHIDETAGFWCCFSIGTHQSVRLASAAESIVDGAEESLTTGVVHSLFFWGRMLTAFVAVAAGASRGGLDPARGEH